MPWTTQQKVQDAERRRLILIYAMGARCTECGCRDLDKLEFHHRFPRTWVARKLSRWARQRKYEEEWEQGAIRLCCGECNKRLGQPQELPPEKPWSDEPESETPF